MILEGVLGSNEGLDLEVHYSTLIVWHNKVALKEEGWGCK